MLEIFKPTLVIQPEVPELPDGPGTRSFHFSPEAVQSQIEDKELILDYEYILVDASAPYFQR